MKFISTVYDLSYQPYHWYLYKYQLDEALNSDINKEKFKNKCFFGTTDISDIAFLWTSYWWEGDILYGEFEILPTPNGKMLEELLKDYDPSDSVRLNMVGNYLINTEREIKIRLNGDTLEKEYQYDITNLLIDDITLKTNLLKAR